MTRPAAVACACLCAALLASCTPRQCSKADDDSKEDVAVVALPAPTTPPVPRKNMAWISAGAFVAGTPPGELPRIADEEMPGVQVVLQGFYIDQYPFPNEPGAIQTTNVTLAEAKSKCEEGDKRLCTELEWERACKGPDSSTYEYGSSYRSSTCDASGNVNLSPTGTRVGCRSGHDVYDMHGGAFEWTASDWNRGGDSGLTVVRGGSGDPGEVVGRCANARARRPDGRYPDVGFRCCAGPANDALVTLDVVRSPEPIKTLGRNAEMSAAIEANLPESLAKTLPAEGRGAFHVDRMWRWYPIGNEELVLASGCGHPGAHAVCGVVIARFKDERVQSLAFAPSGWWLPNVQLDDDRRVLWVYGGDGLGKYRRRVAYLWGRIGVGEPARGSELWRKKKPKKRKR